MNSISKWLKKEFSDGRSIYEKYFLMVGIVLQFLVYMITECSFLSFVSGVSGILAVVLCAQKKISQYFFAFIQMFTYVILAYQQRFYGEIAEYAFYLITMAFGLYIWLNHYDNTEQEVITKKLDKERFVQLLVGTLCGVIVVSLILSLTNDTQPFMDSLSTVPAMVAQVLLILRYREQWVFWLIIDIASIIMWTIADNWIMVVQFIFWTANCIYGYYKWSDETF